MAIELIVSLVTVIISYLATLFFNLLKKSVKIRENEITIKYNKGDSEVTKELLKTLAELEKNEKKDIKVVFSDNIITIKFKTAASQTL